MAKKLIFDVDNTLILWKEEYQKTLILLTIKYNVHNSFEKINKIVASRKPYDILTRENLIQDINSTCNLNLPISFVDELIEGQSINAADSNDIELQETIHYLSTKYELYVLSNWYTKAQEGRLELAKIRHYFKSVIGGDKVKLKPNLESFMIMGNNPASEYIMIGDSIDEDIKPALSLGMDAIIVDLKGKIQEPQKVKVIRRIEELMEIL